SWTILRFDNAGDDWIRGVLAEIHGYHSEWAGGNEPAYDIDIQKGRLLITQPAFSVSTTSGCKHKLNNMAEMEISGWTNSSDVSNIDELFEFEDDFSHVVIKGTSTRAPANLLDSTSKRFTFDKLRLQISGASSADRPGA